MDLKKKRKLQQDHKKGLKWKTGKQKAMEN